MLRTVLSTVPTPQQSRKVSAARIGAERERELSEVHVTMDGVDATAAESKMRLTIHTVEPIIAL